MKKISNHLQKSKCLYVITIVLILILLIFSFAGNNIWPFGEKSLLLWDMEIQYINIYNWFYDVLHGDANIFYDFSKSLGGNTFGIYTTYLTSPLSLLVYFFPIAKMPYYITIATVIKIILAGSLCQLYIRNRFPDIPKYAEVLLAVSYAFCEYNIGLYSNLHFLDIVYILPLLALGSYILIRDHKPFFLIISVAYTIICNWYIGYAACLFTGLYFLFELFLSQLKAKQKIDIFCSFLFASIIGVMISCVTFLPTILSTLNGKGEVSIQYLKSGFHCSIFEPLKALLINSNANMTYEEPAIFVGTLAIVLVITGFFVKKIPIKKRILSLLFLFIILISFSFVPLEVIFSGMKKTYSFHFRYSFVFSFAIITVAALFINDIESKHWQINKSACFAGLLLVLIYELIGIQKQWLDWKSGIIFLVTYIIFLLCIYIINHKISNIYNVFPIGIIIVALCSELIMNASLSLRKANITINEYVSYIQEIDPIINKIKDQDNSSFFRMEKTFSEMDVRRNIGGKTLRPVATEGLTFNYNSITHYSSLIDSRVDDFLALTGYTKWKANCADYVSSNPVMDSFLGIKYLLSNESTALLTESGKFSYWADEEVFIYENDEALNLATEVSHINVTEKWTNNPFENQNLIMNTVYGQTLNLWKQQEIIENGNSKWIVQVNEDGPLYLYFADNHSSCDLLINGEYLETYYGRFYTNILYIGSYKKGESILVELDEDQCEREHILYVYGINEKEYKNVFRNLKDRSLSPDKMNDLSIDLTCDCDEEGYLLLTIPYDDGWQVYVNQKKVIPEIAFDTFIAIPVTNETYEIQLKYHVPHLKLGFTITAAGALIAILIRKRSK